MKLEYNYAADVGGGGGGVAPGSGLGLSSVSGGMSTSPVSESTTPNRKGDPSL
jgi:hypothetical protein